MHEWNIIEFGKVDNTQPPRVQIVLIIALIFTFIGNISGQCIPVPLPLHTCQAVELETEGI